MHQKPHVTAPPLKGGRSRIFSLGNRRPPLRGGGVVWEGDAFPPQHPTLHPLSGMAPAFSGCPSLCVRGYGIPGSPCMSLSHTITHQITRQADPLSMG